MQEFWAHPGHDATAVAEIAASSPVPYTAPVAGAPSVIERQIGRLRDRLPSAALDVRRQVENTEMRRLLGILDDLRVCGGSTGASNRAHLYAATARVFHKGSFAPIGLGTVPIETVKVIRPNHVSGLSRKNVLQCRKRCTGQQKGSPFSPFPKTIRKGASFSLCRGGRDVRHLDHQKQKE